RDYQRAVDEFNRAVEAHNRALAEERARRQAEIPTARRRALEEALHEVLGSPRLAAADYDADNQRFAARIVAANGNWQETVSIPVPLADAPRFKQDLAGLSPKLDFALKPEGFVLAKISVAHAGKTYAAIPDAAATAPAPLSVTLAGGRLPETAALPTLTAERLDTSGLLGQNRAYFEGAVRLENDPALAQQQQRLAEERRRLAEAQAQAARAAEAKRLEDEIRRTQQQLTALGGAAGGEYRGLEPKRAWQFRRAAAPARETVAVAIGNRNYGQGIPKVHYAHNDARAMRQFLVEGLGVPEEHAILALDATLGTMQGLFDATLPARVRSGQKDVVVYFSGHGMATVDNDARLLPTDTQAETAMAAGFSRDALLAKLDGLGARSVTLVLDACFTGTGKDGEALMAAKPVFGRATVARAPRNGVFVASSAPDQVSWIAEDQGMSLLTLHLLEGLAGGAGSTVTAGGLAQYLAERVNRDALRRFSQPQQPQVLGDPARVLVRY
ncbi:MAG: caspase family protein, partial [Alphaproteobacteria bacterium]|nr:caspase family protein [Alphaproteobacteria bacterium]